MFRPITQIIYAHMIFIPHRKRLVILHKSSVELALADPDRVAKPGLFLSSLVIKKRSTPVGEQYVGWYIYNIYRT